MDKRPMSSDRRVCKFTMLLTATVLASLVSCALPCRAASADDTLDAAVRADWAMQERRSQRTADSPAAITDAYRRARALSGDLLAVNEQIDPKRELAALNSLGLQIAGVDRLDEPARLALYHQIRATTRGMALKGPLIAGKPIVFMERRRFICQMLHGHLGCFYDYSDISGGGVYVLEEPGRSLKARDLIAGRLPKGNYTPLGLSNDARTLCFAFAERAQTKPDYYSSERRCFHIYAANVPFYGTYEKQAQLAQKAGRVVPPPQVR